MNTVAHGGTARGGDVVEGVDAVDGAGDVDVGIIVAPVDARCVCFLHPL